MSGRKTLYLLGLLSLASGFLSAGNLGPVDRFVAALQRWAKENPQEKVYLHTDKPYYL